MCLSGLNPIYCKYDVKNLLLPTFSQQICAALAPPLWDEGHQGHLGHQGHQGQMLQHFLHPLNHIFETLSLTNLSYF